MPSRALTGNRVRTHAYIIPLLIILALAWLTRIYALGDDSLWGDEIFSYDRASQASLRDAYAMLVGSTHPPLYELGLLHYWLQLGEGEFFLRFPSAFLGVLTISAEYALGKAAFNAKAGALGALLLAISPLHVYYSREARMYALLACLITLEMYCLHKAMHPSSHADRYWMGFAFLGACSLYTHYYAGLTLLALDGFVLIYLTTHFDPKLLSKWISANLSIILVFAPWRRILWAQMASQATAWIVPMSSQTRRLYLGGPGPRLL